MPGAARATDAEVSRRISQTAEWLAGGLSRREICGNARREWGVSASQADRYSAAARPLLASALGADAACRLAVAEARFERLFGMALEGGDVALAERVLRDEVATLGGLTDGFRRRPWLDG